MRFGRLDRRIAIQAKTVTQSASGQPTEAWSTIAIRFASMAPARGSEAYGTPQIVATQETEFQIRWSAAVAGLSPLHRIVYPVPAGEPAEATIFDIHAVHEIGRREGLRIIAQRRPDA